MFVGLQELLYVSDAILYLVSIVDMQVTSLTAAAFIDLNDGAEEFLHAGTVLKRSGHHGHTEQRAERLQVDMVATAFEFVIHIQGTHKSDVHIDKLCRQVEVAFQVGGIDNVDDNVWHFLRKVLTHIEFFRRIAREGISSRKVNQLEFVTEERGAGFSGIDSDSRVVAHTGMGSTGKIEERGLATVGVANECYADGTTLAHGFVVGIRSPFPSLKSIKRR